MNKQKEPLGGTDRLERFGGISASDQLLSVCGGVAALLLLALAAQLLILSLSGILFPSAAEWSWYSAVISTVSMYLIAAPLSYFVFRLGRSYAPARNRSLSFSALLGLLVLSFAIATVGNLFGSLVQHALSALTGNSAVNPVEVQTLGTPLWTNLIFFGILAPVVEEIVYRKLVIDRLRPLGDGAAVVLSGLLFGLVHGNFHQLFYATLFGFLAGFVYVATGKLRYTILLHMAVNLVGGVFSAELFKKLGGTAGVADLAARFVDAPVAARLYQGYSLLMILCVLLAPLVLFLLRKHAEFERDPGAPSPACVLRILSHSPAFWLLSAVLLLLFLL